MKNANFLLLVFLVMGATLNAQQILCTQQSENYIVDAGDASATGSYSWTLEDATNADLSGQIVNSTTNDVTIDWENNVFDTYTLPHTFTLTVVETVGGCSADPETYTVTLINGYEAPAITTTVSPVCIGDPSNSSFLLTAGTAGAIVGYTLTSDGGYSETQTVTLDASGGGTINYPSLTDANTSETFTLTLTSIDDSGTDSCDALDLTSDSITQTVTINPIPVTSGITPVIVP